MRNSEINKKFDIFLSYQWNKKHLVKQLYNKLKEEYNLALWLDEQETDASGNLFEQLAKGLNNSKIVLCFITREYCKSENCISEITYARDNCIPIIVLMMERLNLMITSELCDPNTKMLKVDPVKLDYGVLKIGYKYERFIEIRNDDNLTNRIQVRKASDCKFVDIDEFTAGKVFKQMI